jgi:DNA-binding NtrC family response regulator
VQAFITSSTRNQKSMPGVEISGDADARAVRWPGNVRELRNVIERATILAPARSSSRSTCRRRWRRARRHQPQVRSRRDTVEEAERRLIMMTLEHTRDNKTRAAEILGISLKTLHNKLNKLRLRPNKKE